MSKYIKIIGNEDEMIIIHTTKLEGMEFNKEQQEDINKFLECLYNIFLGTVMSDNLFPVLWQNLIETLKQNREIIKKEINNEENN